MDFKIEGSTPATSSAPSISPKKQKELDKLKKACADFESIFVHQLFKEMRKTVHKTGVTSGSKAEEIFSDMLDQERSKKMQLGLGDMLFNQLSATIIPPKRGRYF